MKNLVLLAFSLSICLFVSDVSAQEKGSYDDRAFMAKDDDKWSIGLSVGALLYDNLGYSTYYSSDITEGQILDVGQFPISADAPSFTLSGQYNPNSGGGSFDTSIMYTKHKVSESSDAIADFRKVILLTGGNYHFGQTDSAVRPYVTADFGVAFNNVDWGEGHLPIGYAGGSGDGDGDDSHRASPAADALGYATGGHTHTPKGDDNSLNGGHGPYDDELVNNVDNWASSIVSSVGAGVDVKLGSVELGLLYNYLFTAGYHLNYEWTRENADVSNIGYQSRFNVDDLGGHRVEVKATVPVVLFKKR